MKTDQSRYFVETAAKVLDILESFGGPDEDVSIKEIARRTHLTYSSAFRLMNTLESRGYVMRHTRTKRYRLSPPRKRFRIGYAGLRTTKFHREVTTAMALAARKLCLELVTRFNDEFNLTKALMNADQLLADDVRLLIEYQYNDTACELIAAKCHDARVPAISINFAQPGAYYFGGNNYETGALAGEFLCQFAMRNWEGRADACLVLPAKGLGSTREAREAGLRDALRRGLPALRGPGVVMVPPALTVKEGYILTRKLLREIGARNKHVLIACFTDHLGLGAEKAIQDAGLTERAVIIGQGGGHDARTRIAKGGPFRASVAFFSEAYGERVLSLAVKILEGESAPAPWADTNS